MVVLIVLSVVPCYSGSSGYTSYYRSLNKFNVLRVWVNVSSVGDGDNVVEFNVYLELMCLKPLIIYWIEPQVYNVSLGFMTRTTIVEPKGPYKQYVVLQIIGFMGSSGDLGVVRINRSFTMNITWPSNYTIYLYLNNDLIHSDNIYLDVPAIEPITPIIIIREPLSYRFSSDLNIGLTDTHISDNTLVINLTISTAGPCGVLYGELGNPLVLGHGELEILGEVGGSPNIVVDSLSKRIEIHYVYMLGSYVCLAQMILENSYTIELPPVGDEEETWDLVIYVNGEVYSEYTINRTVYGGRNNQSSTNQTPAIENNTSIPSNTNTMETPITSQTTSHETGVEEHNTFTWTLILALISLAILSTIVIVLWRRRIS